MDSVSFLREINQEMTAPKQIALVQKQIDLHQEELKSLESSIEERQKQFNTNEASMKILGLKYCHAKRLLEAHKRDLSAHQRDLADLAELQRCLEAEAGVQGEELVDFLPPVSNQTSQKLAEITVIASKVKEMEEEAHASRFAQRISQQHLSVMKDYRKGILSALAGLKTAFSPIHKVPAEYWATVFRYRVEGDFETHAEAPDRVASLSTPLNLSHVCSFWRQVISVERDLWKYFICGPDNARTEPQVERWKHYTSFEPRTFTFLTDLHTRSKPPISKPTVEMARVMSSRSHSIHIITGVCDKAILDAQGLPFNGQSSVTFQVDEPATKEFIEALCACFPLATTIKFKFEPTLSNLSPNIYRREPPIERLFMDLSEFKPFRIDYYYREHHIRELHVVHDGKNALWVMDYELPAMQKSVLYGPKSPTVVAPCLLELSRHPDFNRIRDLELRNWPRYKPTDTSSWSIAPLILAIADNLRLVETIRCIDSFIEGEYLVSLIKLVMDIHKTTAPSKLKKVVIDSCSGITRGDCEFIAASVETLVVHQCNVRITAPKDVAYVQEEISLREEELLALEARLLADRKKLESHETTVMVLIIKIDYAKRRLAAQERYLADLLELKQQLDTADGTIEEVEPLPDQIMHHKQEVAILAPKIQEMTQELHAKRLIHNASKTYLKALEIHKDFLLDMLKGLKAAFSSSRAIPAEVLAAIFYFRLEDDVMCYLESCGRYDKRYTPLILSQVCSFWREVAHAEKNIWRYFIDNLRQISAPIRVEIWKHFVSFGSGSPTFIASLDDIMPSAITTNYAALNPSPTSAYLVSKASTQTMPPNISFRLINSLTVEMDFSPTVQFIDMVHGAFPMVTTIHFICSAHLPQMHTNLYTRRGPEITSLRMDLTTFDTFGINYYGNIGLLEELHVIHNGVNHLVVYSIRYQYRKLTILGITPPDDDWIASARFPLLRQLVLYGPKIRTLVSPQLSKLSNHPNFPQIKEFGLMNWPVYTPVDAPSWSVMQLILPIADKLRLVETFRFVDSFIEGEGLVTLVKLLMDTNGNQTPPKLKTVILDCCSGTTRRDCELITEVVEKLVVYV